MTQEYSKIMTECEHSPILDEIRGEYICSKCGLVIKKQYVSPSYQMNETTSNDFKNNKHYVALGKRLNMVDGLGSFIDYQYKSKFNDSSGKVLSPKKQVLYKRLKYFYDIRSRYVNQETDYNVFNLLNRVTAKLKLSDNIRDRAAYFYNKITTEVSKDDITNHIILIAMCIFVAIREYKHNAPVTIQELANIFEDIGHRVSPRTILREIQKVSPYVGNLLNPQTRKSEDYINRIISKIINSNVVLERLFKYDEEVNNYKIYLQNKCFSLFKKFNIKKRGGRNPYIFAVAILYTSDRIFAKQKHRRSILTQKILSDVCDCAEYSIRDHFKFIKSEFLREKSIEF
ncbi:MAG: transcription initiation factor IIB family protein [Promethearchaeota archaeon]|nr:MAG: transcription initiation factor IIB family protein [Candidatus Lokiarchaeota archaeon]